MKDKIVFKIKENICRYYPVYFWGMIWFIYQYCMKAWTGDEWLYADLLNKFSVGGVAVHYYETWSSRIILDVLGAITHHYPLIFFKALNTVVMMLEALGIICLCRDDSIQNQCVVVSLLCLFSYSSFYDCGFSITALYYIWPVTAGIWAICFCIRQYSGKYIWLGILSEIFCVIIADNMEQVLIIVLGIQFCLVCFSLKKKKHNIVLYIGFLLSVMSLIFTMTAPGKALRFAYEIAVSFPEYKMLPFIQKLNLGFTTTMHTTVLFGDITFLMAVGAVFLLLFFSNKPNWEKVIGAIPFSICLMFGPLHGIISGMFPNIYRLRNISEYGIGTLTDFDMINTWVPFFLMVFFMTTFLIAIWLGFDCSEKSILLIAVIVLGLLSRMAMGFSPTIYSSGNRTFYPMWATLVIFTVFAYKNMGRCKKIFADTSVFMGILAMIVIAGYIK